VKSLPENRLVSDADATAATLPMRTVVSGISGGKHPKISSSFVVVHFDRRRRKSQERNYSLPVPLTLLLAVLDALAVDSVAELVVLAAFDAVPEFELVVDAVVPEVGVVVAAEDPNPFELLLLPLLPGPMNC
jgi:hypothetical protein